MAAVYNDHVDNAENDSVIVTTFRIACAVPPLLCALLWRDFAAIVGYAGETTGINARDVQGTEQRRREEYVGTGMTGGWSRVSGRRSERWSADVDCEMLSALCARPPQVGVETQERENVAQMPINRQLCFQRCYYHRMIRCNPM